MKRDKVFKLAEMFCGPGGLSLGATAASVKDQEGRVYRVKPVWANDIDSDACKTYARNIHNGKDKRVVNAPIQSVDFNAIPLFDAFAFGFPCNDFSVLGEQKGIHGKYGPLYSFGVRALELRNPKWFIAENVSGLQSANSGTAFLRILADLEGAGKGYCLNAHLYKFEDYGVPQTRHRIVIVGIRKDLRLDFHVPAPTTANKFVTAREAIERPPIPPDAHNNERAVQSKAVIERLKHIPPGQNAWFKGLPEYLKLNVRMATLSQIYKRLRADKPAYAITGSGGGGTHGYHWRENRALTNRERARLQTFPDDFVFEGGKDSVRKQIGMAVPPRAAKTIVEAVLKTFAGVSYRSLPASIYDGSQLTLSKD